MIKPNFQCPRIANCSSQSLMKPRRFRIIIQRKIRILQKLIKAFITIAMHGQSLRRLYFVLTYSKSQILPIPKQIFYETVKNTKEYSEFIPWCTSSIIKQNLSANENYTTLTISFNELKHISYTSHVTIEEKDNQHKITSICREYPLKELKSVWTVRKIDEESAEVDYFLDFQFDSPIYQLMSSIFLNIMGKSMWDVFVKRAKRNLFFSREKNPQKAAQSSPLSKNIKDGDFDTLEEYLNSRPKILKIYLKRTDLKDKIDSLAQRFKNTNNFQEKLDFQIKNIFIHQSVPFDHSYFP